MKSQQQDFDTMPQNWEVVARWVPHPEKPLLQGELVQQKETGVFQLLVDGKLTPVPQIWALSAAAWRGTR